MSDTPEHLRSRLPSIYMNKSEPATAAPLPEATLVERIHYYLDGVNAGLAQDVVKALAAAQQEIAALKAEIEALKCAARS